MAKMTRGFDGEMASDVRPMRSGLGKPVLSCRQFWPPSVERQIPLAMPCSVTVAKTRPVLDGSNTTLWHQ